MRGETGLPEVVKVGPARILRCQTLQFAGPCTESPCRVYTPDSVSRFKPFLIHFELSLLRKVLC